ncbi:MAG: 30S ribosomal protein S17 [Candidatus Lloydbacteria bacterium CG22_combo_CG10-13_8_21_14_all_47_15]|uniref:Small ribosomal subunit protein uS17 n=1 Tax=Candidatus Lloydbacteria bacterium CG22_combo_CG10-13_8_21_14_all_47_15 TaxID=1974635 RepID=A0A2H0CV90_9BACT|nr:MAG: 30S ribosomal protein S17 [Candidatus Lloydbacteria bacterium CG22_combo_CG10-13_8_21_14_all_47_15]
MQDAQSKPKKLQGRVVSTAMEKTIVVLVDRFVKHPKYGKYMRMSKKYKAHDETGAHKVGDTVAIEECRPYSKDTHFKIVEK